MLRIIRNHINQLKYRRFSMQSITRINSRLGNIVSRVATTSSSTFNALKERILHQLEYSMDASTLRLIDEIKRMLDVFNSNSVEIEAFFEREELEELECPIMRTIMHTPIMCLLDKFDAMPLTLSLDAFKQLSTNKNPIVPSQTIVDARLDSHRLRLIHKALQTKAKSLNLIPPPSEKISLKTPNSQLINHSFKVEDFKTLPNIRTFFDCLFLTGVLNNDQYKELTVHEDLNQSQQSLLKLLGDPSKNLKTEIQQALELYSYHTDERNTHVEATSCNSERIKEMLSLVRKIYENPQTNRELELDLYHKFLSEFKYRNKLEMLLSILKLQNIPLKLGYTTPIPYKIITIFKKISNDSSGCHKLITALTQCTKYDLKEQKKIGSEFTNTEDHWDTKLIEHTIRNMHISIYSDTETVLGPWFNSSIWLEIMSIFDTSQKLDILLSLLEINGLTHSNTRLNCIRLPNTPDCISIIKEAIEDRNNLDKRELFIDVIKKCLNYPPIPTMEKVSKGQEPSWNAIMLYRVENQLESEEYEQLEMSAFFSTNEELWRLLFDLFDTNEKINLFIEKLEEYNILSERDKSMFSWKKSVPACIIQIKKLLEQKANRLELNSLQDILPPIKRCYYNR